MYVLYVFYRNVLLHLETNKIFTRILFLPDGTENSTIQVSQGNHRKYVKQNQWANSGDLQWEKTWSIETNWSTWYLRVKGMFSKSSWNSSVQCDVLINSLIVNKMKSLLHHEVCRAVLKKPVKIAKLCWSCNSYCI